MGTGHHPAGTFLGRAFQQSKQAVGGTTIYSPGRAAQCRDHRPKPPRHTGWLRRPLSRSLSKAGLFGPEHCVGDRAEQDYIGKVLVLSPDTLKESCWSQENQLWYAHDGFGCSPHAIGRSVRCTCLSDGEMTRWNRDEFVGVLDEKFLPDWAKESLSQFQQEEAAESPGMNNQSV